MKYCRTLNKPGYCCELQLLQAVAQTTRNVQTVYNQREKYNSIVQILIWYVTLFNRSKLFMCDKSIMMLNLFVICLLSKCTYSFMAFLQWRVTFEYGVNINWVFWGGVKVKARDLVRGHNLYTHMTITWQKRQTNKNALRQFHDQLISSHRFKKNNRSFLYWRTAPNNFDYAHISRPIYRKHCTRYIINQIMADIIVCADSYTYYSRY